jgi:hypothetical protein
MLAFSPTEIDKKQTYMKIYQGGSIKQLFHRDLIINIFIHREVIAIQSTNTATTIYINKEDLKPFFLLIDTMQQLLTWLLKEQHHLNTLKQQSMVNYCKINTAISKVGFELDTIIEKYEI